MRALLAVMSSLLGAVPGAAAEPAALAVIDVRPFEGSVEIVGKAVGVTAGTVSGEMVIDRKGASGVVSTRQSGQWNLAPGQSQDIARIGLSFSAGDTLDVTVTLKQDGVVIARTSLNVPPGN